VARDLIGDPDLTATGVMGLWRPSHGGAIIAPVLSTSHYLDRSDLGPILEDGKANPVSQLRP
jgi:hypothetical protein